MNARLNSALFGMLLFGLAAPPVANAGAWQTCGAKEISENRMCWVDSNTPEASSGEKSAQGTQNTIEAIESQDLIDSLVNSLWEALGLD